MAASTPRSKLQAQQRTTPISHPMAVNPTRRTLQTLARQVKSPCPCSNNLTTSSIRHFSSTLPNHETASSTTYKPLSTEPSSSTPPRWSQTPERMRSPVRIRIRDNTKPFECNTDPARLDQFYKRFLGPGGENVLSEETKWLAVTHKSFEQGARGFNDRLAFFGRSLSTRADVSRKALDIAKMFGLHARDHTDVQFSTGRRILTMQTNLVLLNSSAANKTQRLTKTDGDRAVFEHPALEGLENLSDVPINEILTKQRLATLAAQMDMPAVIRWLPRIVSLPMKIL